MTHPGTTPDLTALAVELRELITHVSSMILEGKKIHVDDNRWYEYDPNVKKIIYHINQPTIDRSPKHWWKGSWQN